ncbi:NAD(P)-binding protein [Caldimonas sp. KR1-144]|uniref:NAD(P)-binding protein n=1 Tax=Caldimonas sp. KR1-144 TaxID=3400911 RepID=UPI003C025239
MTSLERRLGLDAPITRRDFLQGVALSGAGLAAGAQAASPGGYLGQTDADSAALHALRFGAERPELPAFDAARDETHDLVVVGSGISGLSAAWLYRRHAGAAARVLVLDGQAELGGHALRNEFVSAGGRRVIGYGGSQSLDSPSQWSPAARALVADVGIDLARFEQWYDRRWSEARCLTRRAMFFDQAQWGEDRFVRHAADAKTAQWAALTPLHPRAAADLAGLIERPRDWLPGLSCRAKRERLASITYDDFLTRLCGLDAQLTRFFSTRTRAYLGAGTDAASALDAYALGLPGFAAMSLGGAADEAMSPSARQAIAGRDAYIYHFPDGNAGLVRALLRGLIPAALPGEGIESLVLAESDDAQLDSPGNAVRIRLRSPVLRVRHAGAPRDAQAVDVSYLDAQDRTRTVRARHVVLACWSRVIPLLCGDELPRRQIEALDDQVKVPLVYANVLLRGWQAFAAAGIDGFSIPGADLFTSVGIDMPVSIGSYRFADRPDDPVLLHLSAVVLGGAPGSSPREQAAAGRARLATLRFEDLERAIRSTLQRALGAFGFEAARDIEAITINRWAHGYAYEYMRPWDRYWPRGALPALTARRGWGRVAIANSDAGAFAYAHGAIDQAVRAVGELLPQARLPRAAQLPGPFGG